jgi:hypothetical protein
MTVCRRPKGCFFLALNSYSINIPASAQLAGFPKLRNRHANHPLQATGLAESLDDSWRRALKAHEEQVAAVATLPAPQRVATDHALLPSEGGRGGQRRGRAGCEPVLVACWPHADSRLPLWTVHRWPPLIPDAGEPVRRAEAGTASQLDRSWRSIRNRRATCEGWFWIMPPQRPGALILRTNRAYGVPHCIRFRL